MASQADEAFAGYQASGLVPHDEGENSVFETEMESFVSGRGRGSPFRHGHHPIARMRDSLSKMHALRKIRSGRVCPCCRSRAIFSGVVAEAGRDGPSCVRHGGTRERGSVSAGHSCRAAQRRACQATLQPPR